MNPETNTTPSSSPGYTPPDLSGGAGLRPRRKRIVLLLVALVLLLAAAFAARYFLLKDDKPAAKQTNNTTTEEEDEGPPEPFALAYSVSTDQGGGKLKLHELKTGKDTEVDTFKEGVYIVETKIQGEKIAVMTTGVDEDGDIAAIWYSDDSGQTYDKVYGAKSTADPDALGAQITSFGFAKDGKSIAFGLLPEAGGDVTAKEVNLATKKVKDLFTLADTSGLFISAYDPAAKRIYYYTGCYNCDGNLMNKLLVRDLATGTETALYDATGKVGTGTMFNKDQTKVLLGIGDQGEDLGEVNNVTLKEVTVADGSVREITPTAEPGHVSALGYVDGGKQIFYAKADSLYYVGEDGASIKQYQAPINIMYVHYASEDRAIVTAGDYSTFKTVDFDLAKQTPKDLLEGDAKTYPFGITWK